MARHFLDQARITPEDAEWFEEHITPRLIELRAWASDAGRSKLEADELYTDLLIRLWVSGRLRFDPSKGTLEAYCRKILKNLRKTRQRSMNHRQRHEVPLDEHYGYGDEH